VTVALKAADQLALQGVAAEVVDLRSLRPLDEHAILTSVAKTNRAVVVEEGWPHCGIGAQVVDIIQRDAFDLLDAPVQRVTQADVPMPYNKQLERLAKPSIEKVVGQRGGSCTSTKAMATKVVMEALSPTMEEGRLVKWAKRAGDAVKTGETLAEVETDKAVMELVARADGQLLQQLAPEGATVPVGEVVAYIGAPGETVGAAAAPPAAAPPAGEAGPVPLISAQPAPAGRPAAASTPAVAAAPADATRVKASPLAKRIAQETGVDLRVVLGSGPGGRVIKRDLDAAVPRPPATTSAVALVEPRPTPGAAAVMTTGAAYEDVPLTQIRKAIAKRLATSIGPVPHYFLTTEVDMERAAEAR
jgi:biotin carboxyl carrier protein